MTQKEFEDLKEGCFIRLTDPLDLGAVTIVTGKEHGFINFIGGANGINSAEVITDPTVADWAAAYKHDTEHLKDVLTSERQRNLDKNEKINTLQGQVDALKLELNMKSTQQLVAKYEESLKAQIFGEVAEVIRDEYSKLTGCGLRTYRAVESIAKRLNINLTAEKTAGKEPQMVIKCELRVRYPEDSEINGEPDSETDPQMPCMTGTDDEWYWKPIINVETGQITNWEAGTTAEISYKVCDECGLKIYRNGIKVLDYEEYVPDFLYPREAGHGDYVYMDIDEHGIILGWDKTKVLDFIKEQLKTNNHD